DGQRRMPTHHAARRYVVWDDRAGADERLLADLDPWQEHGAAANPCSAPNGRATPNCMTLLGAAHVVVVGRDDARGNEDVFLQGGIGGDVGIGLYACTGADRRVVLHVGAAADDDLV